MSDPNQQFRTTNKQPEAAKPGSEADNTVETDNEKPEVDLSRNQGTRPTDAIPDTTKTPADRGTGTDSVPPHPGDDDLAPEEKYLPVPGEDEDEDEDEDKPSAT